MTSAAAVDHDVVCLGCAYNLRGLPEIGNCPECGWPVLRSLRGDLLRHADEAWVARVRRGLSLVYASILSTLVLFLVGFVLFVILAVFSGFFRSFGGSGRPLAYVLGATSLVLVVLYPLGWWFVTTPDPGERREDAGPRRVLRVTALLFFPVLVVWRYYVDNAPAWPGTPILIEVGSHLRFGLIWLHLVGMTRVLARLHDRTRAGTPKETEKGRKSIRRASDWALRAPAVLLAIHWVYGVAALAVPPMNAPPSMGLGTGIGAFLILLLWLSTIEACLVVSRAVKSEQLAAFAREVSSGDDSGVHQDEVTS